jgi:hypothetical protein
MRRGRVIRFPLERRGVVPADEPLAEIHRCDQGEAMVVKSLFESEGIPTLLRSRVAHSVHPFTVGAQGEVIVFVPRREATRATRLMSRIIPQPPVPKRSR